MAEQSAFRSREIVEKLCACNLTYQMELWGKQGRNFSHHLYIVTCYLGSQPIRRFIARQQLCKYTTVMETLLDSSYRITMEIKLEGVFYVVRPEAVSRQ
jgi:hypothetical protein